MLKDGWMVIKDRIKNENRQSMLEVAPIEGKTRESFEIVWSCKKDTRRWKSDV